MQYPTYNRIFSDEGSDSSFEDLSLERQAHRIIELKQL